MTWLLALLAVTGVACVLEPVSYTQEQAADVLVRRQSYLMGTRADLSARAPTRDSGLAVLDRMVRELESTEREVSTWRDESLLGRLNLHPVGAPFPASPGLCSLIDELRHWNDETNGAFDPAVGALVEAWGLRDGGRIPLPEVLESARKQSGIQHVSARSGPCTVTRRADVVIDAGAFGKGMALDRLVARNLGADRGWLVDLGGQVAVGPERDHSWAVALAHPVWRDRSIVELQLRSGSLAVSGGSERDQHVDDVRVGHILDPRTGRPVSRSFSVVVWHPRALVADILSTALYVMGVDEGLAWAESQGVAACFIVLVPGEVPSPRPHDVGLTATTDFTRRFL